MSLPIIPILSVTPSRALMDEKFKVLVENLPPGRPVTLRSHHCSEDQDDWEAYAHYVSSHAGVVSVADDLSIGGTYQGKEPMGLLWSLRPVPGSRKGLRLRKMNVCTPLLVHISVYEGHLSGGFSERCPLASVLTERWYMAPGVKRVPLNEGRVQGTFFIPPGPGPFPGVLDMWGGGGGLIEYRSALLASHGYVSLALQYVAAGELESYALDQDYLENAFMLVKEHPKVIPGSVGMFGLSLGSILSLYMAVMSNIAKPRCCVCISGTHTYQQDHRLSHLAEELVKNDKRVRMDEDSNQIWRDNGLPIPDDLSHKLDVTKINCPLLLVNGRDDQNNPTVECAEDIAKMMAEAGKEHLLTSLSYPETGHLIEPPFSPHFRASNFKLGRKIPKVLVLWGGQTKPHSDAQEDSWNKILAFLKHHLYPSACPRARM